MRGKPESKVPVPTMMYASVGGGQLFDIGFHENVMAGHMLAPRIPVMVIPLTRAAYDSMVEQIAKASCKANHDAAPSPWRAPLTWAARSEAIRNVYRAVARLALKSIGISRP